MDSLDIMLQLGAIARRLRDENRMEHDEIETELVESVQEIVQELRDGDE